MNNKTHLTDYLKDLLFYLLKGLGILVGLVIGGFYILSLDGMLSSLHPELKIPWWAAIFALSQFGLMYWFRYKGKLFWVFLYGIMAILNYIILFFCNQLYIAG